MLAFLLSRVLQAAGVLVTVGLIAFAVVRSAGDPVSQMVGPDTPPAERAAIRRSLGLDDPVPAQAMRYLGQAARFDFGASYRLRQPVADLLKERLPATLELALCATLLGLGLRGADGCLRGGQARRWCGKAVPGAVAGRRQPADVPDRSPADLGFRGHARLAAVLRARRDGAAGTVDHRPPHRLRPQGTGPARAYPRPLSNDAPDAPDARRDAGGAARRFHPLRPGAGLASARFISVTR